LEGDIDVIAATRDFWQMQAITNSQQGLIEDWKMGQIRALKQTGRSRLRLSGQNESLGSIKCHPEQNSSRAWCV